MNPYQPKPYELKIAELQKRIEEESKNLQKVIEAKDSSLREIKIIAGRKSLLKNQIDSLENQIKDKEVVLQNTIDRKTVFIENAKQNLKNKKEAVREVQKVLQKTTKDLENLNTVADELQVFISENSDARLKYLTGIKKLEKVEKEYQKTSPLIEKEKQEIQKEKQELDQMKSYVTDLYGKLASYTKVAKETLEYVNKHIEETGIQFEVPKVKVNINNFNE